MGFERDWLASLEHRVLPKAHADRVCLTRTTELRDLDAKSPDTCSDAVWIPRCDRHHGRQWRTLTVATCSTFMRICIMWEEPHYRSPGERPERAHALSGRGARDAEKEGGTCCSESQLGNYIITCAFKAALDEPRDVERCESESEPVLE